MSAHRSPATGTMQERRDCLHIAGALGRYAWFFLSLVKLVSTPRVAFREER